MTLDLGRRDPEEGLRELALFTWRYFVAHPELISLLNTENLLRARFLKGSRRIRKMHTHLVDQLASVLDRGARSGVFAAGLDPLRLAPQLHLRHQFGDRGADVQRRVDGQGDDRDATKLSADLTKRQPGSLRALT